MKTGKLAAFFDDPSEDTLLIQEARKLGRIGEYQFLLDVGSASETLVPNAPMPIEEWAPAHAFIPSSKSTRGGPARLTAPQRGLARLLQKFGTDVLLNIKCPRLGISTLASIFSLYYGGWEQSDVLIYERSKDTAQVFSKDKLMPIVRASTGLKALLRPDGKTGEQDTWDNRELMNGASIKLRSIENEDSFKGIRGRLIVCEEAGDAGWQSGGAKSREGSKLELAMRRGQEFANGRVFLSGTPTIKGSCLISEQWELSNQHFYRMPCPHCGHRQEFVPDVKPAPDPTGRYGPGLRFSQDANGVPDACWYECANRECSAPAGRIDEVHKSSMMDLGDFDLVRVGEPGKIGTFIWMAYSEDPKATWLDVAKAYVKQWVNGTEETRKAFITMFLAQPYDPAPTVVVDPSRLQANKIDLPPGVDAPADAVYLVASVDNQRGRSDDPENPPRGEMTILAACKNNRWHVVDHLIVSHLEYQTGHGELKQIGIDPFGEEYADAIHAAIDREYVTEDGRRLRIQKTAIDCGWQTELAWKFCTMRSSKERGIVPVLGDKTERAGKKVPLLPSNGALRQSKKSGRSYVYIGTRDAKEEVARRFQIPAPAPGSITFAAHLSDRYFAGLLAERLVETKPGIRNWVSVGDDTGEPWDCLQYAYAMKELVILKNKRLRHLVDDVDPALAQAVVEARVEEKEAEDAPADGPPPSVLPDPDDDQPPASSGVRFRVVERKTRRTEPTVETERRIDRVKRRQARTGLGW